MIYKFKSDAAGDIIMMGPSGDAVLRLMGKEPASKGIIEVAAMPAAIAAIEQAAAADDAAREKAREEAREKAREEADRDGGKLPSGDGVTLRQRAWPLVEMMKRSIAEKADIVWGV